MKHSIIAKGLTCYYHNKKILDNVDFEIEKGSFVSIVGPSGSGKSMIAKVLVGLIPYEGNVSVSNMTVVKENLEEIRKQIGLAFENPDNSFVVDSVEEELAFTLENLNYATSTIQKKVLEIARYLEIEHLLKRTVNQLSGGEKQLVSLAAILITNPKILILDEAFVMLDGVSHKKMLNVIKKINQEKKITIINITHDMNDTIYSDRIIVMNQGKVYLDDIRDSIYNEEKKLRAVGLLLPFMVDLSNKLRYYGLVDKIILNKNQMVERLWK